MKNGQKVSIMHDNWDIVLIPKVEEGEYIFFKPERAKELLRTEKAFKAAWNGDFAKADKIMERM